MLPGGPGIPQPLPPAGGGHWDQDQVDSSAGFSLISILIAFFTIPELL